MMFQLFSRYIDINVIPGKQNHVGKAKFALKPCIYDLIPIEIL